MSRKGPAKIPGVLHVFFSGKYFSINFHYVYAKHFHYFEFVLGSFSIYIFLNFQRHLVYLLNFLMNFPGKIITAKIN